MQVLVIVEYGHHYIDDTQLLLRLHQPRELLVGGLLVDVRACLSLCSHSSSSRYWAIATPSKLAFMFPPISLAFVACCATNSGSSARATYALAVCQSNSFVRICKRFAAHSRALDRWRSGSCLTTLGGSIPSSRAAAGSTRDVRVCRRCGVVLVVLGGNLLILQSSRA